MKTKPVAERWTAHEVMELLRRRYEDRRRYVFLEEVVLAGRISDSRIDAAVWSCYESDGQGLTAFEVKVSRFDWLREIRDPGKNAIWWAAADRFVYVAPGGVILPGEIPKGCGWMHAFRTKGGGLRMRQAPERTGHHLNLRLVTTLLRTAARQCLDEEPS